jgi:hypothetical protein
MGSFGLYAGFHAQTEALRVRGGFHSPLQGEEVLNSLQTQGGARKCALTLGYFISRFQREETAVQNPER